MHDAAAAVAHSVYMQTSSEDHRPSMKLTMRCLTCLQLPRIVDFDQLRDLPLRWLTWPLTEMQSRRPLSVVGQIMRLCE